MFKAWIQSALGRAGFVIVNTRKRYNADGVSTIHNDHFRHDQAFQRAYQRGIQANDGVDPDFQWRVHVALWAASCTLQIPGDFIECGVNKGFISSAIMQRLDWRKVPKRFYLIDTFAGPDTSQFSADEIQGGRLKVAQDCVAAGAYETDVAHVRANFAEWPNASVIQGVIPDVLQQVDVPSVAFLHIDMNCAYPERAALEYFWPRLSPGALVLLDDYAYFGYESQMETMDGLARSLGFEILSLPTGQGLIRKA
jgi:Macrocin-O-methyltransferase (TylF)